MSANDVGLSGTGDDLGSEETQTEQAVVRESGGLFRVGATVCDLGVRCRKAVSRAFERAQKAQRSTPTDIDLLWGLAYRSIGNSLVVLDVIERDDFIERDHFWESILEAVENVFEESNSRSRKAGGSDARASGEGECPLSGPDGPTLPKGRVNFKRQSGSRASTASLADILLRAEGERINLRERGIDVEHLLLAMLEAGGVSADILRRFGLDAGALRRSAGNKRSLWLECHLASRSGQYWTS